MNGVANTILNGEDVLSYFRKRFITCYIVTCDSNIIT